MSLVKPHLLTTASNLWIMASDARWPRWCHGHRTHLSMLVAHHPHILLCYPSKLISRPMSWRQTRSTLHIMLSKSCHRCRMRLGDSRTSLRRWRRHDRSAFWWSRNFGAKFYSVDPKILCLSRVSKESCSRLYSVFQYLEGLRSSESGFNRSS